MYVHAETSQQPKHSEIVLLGIQSPKTHNSLLYRIHWAKPSVNVEAFDLDHYELTIGSHSTNHTMRVDAKENDLIVSLIMKQKTAAAVVVHIRQDRRNRSGWSGQNRTTFSALGWVMVGYLIYRMVKIVR